MREFGVITRVDPGRHTVTFIEAQLFTGADAEREAARDGVHLPGPMYIRTGDREVTLTIAPDARIRLLVNDEQSGALLPSLVPTSDFFDPDPRSATDFYWFSVVDGTAVAIEAIESP